MRRFLSLLLTPVVLVALAAPASAQPTLNYHGVWDSVTYKCSPPRAASDLMGVWNVTIDDSGAVGRVVIFVENQDGSVSDDPRSGELHALWQLPFTVHHANASGFKIIAEVYGDTLTMTLSGDQLTYTIVGLPGCRLVTLTGTQTTP